MAVDYKRELEAAAKNMLLVHDPDVLIKMIVRTIVQKVKVRHAGILLHDRQKDTYVLTVSRGQLGLKIPAGFARMDADNSLIRFFRQRKDRLFGDGAIVYDEAKRFLSKKTGADIKQLLKEVLYQMEIFESVACIPSYFRDELLGVLFLGGKKNGKKFGRKELDFFIALTSDVAMAIRNAQLFAELQLELDRRKRLFLNTTIAFAAAIDAKDHYTHGHTTRVTDLSLKIARRLMQENKAAFGDKFLENLHIAGLLHDIGKIGIAESILNKQGPLDEQERKKMQEHTLVGATILQHIQELDECVLGIKYHHEKYDGTGYPKGLKGAEIPPSAAIIAVADTFDAMTSDRPYRRGLSRDTAIEEIKRQSGKQFDPQVVNAFLGLCQEAII